MAIDSGSACAWATQWLVSCGESIDGGFRTVRAMPWAHVFQASTTTMRRVFLKVPAPDFARDAPLMTYLACRTGGSVARILAFEPQTGCFLMRDEGRPLREVLRERMDTGLLMKALSGYSAMQVATVSCLDDFFRLGLPDWRLDALPGMFSALLGSGHLERHERMSAEEVCLLRDSLSLVVSLCERLAAMGIPAGFEHGDLHDNNILTNGQSAVVSDFGESVVTHPFFSLAKFLSGFQRRHEKDASDVVVRSVRDAYLAPWSAFGDTARLDEAFRLVERLFPLYFALAFAKLWTCLPENEMVPFTGWIAPALREFVGREKL